ncbi:toxin-antitoxin system protein [Prevotella brunnea]|uniref:Toxin-antitoxin system protein n=1 Tax=Prevotella brunnea TaxID=2508867 RepID=A0A5C8GDT4_9BACT|nr:toxin-antitoxin system protein [Prevotella brunnea]TXJ60026.1 toxin-antitoxin system protein [Prevotella brunnea]
MEKSLQQFNFESLTESFSAYHCFGDKATGILSSIDQPYKDITHWSVDDLRSKTCIAIFVFTDDAEVYAAEIDAFIRQYEDMVKHIFILDLHASHQYKMFKKRWEFYNILTTRYCTLQENILHYLLFFKHFIETIGLISMDFGDFKICMRTATFIATGKAGAIKESIDAIPHKNIHILMLGLELQSNEIDNAKEDMDALASFFDQLPDSVEVKWQISHNFGNPHVEYIAGFDIEPVYGTTHS